MTHNKKCFVVLHSDFGQSHYIGEMEGVILKINPNARVVHGAHDLPKHYAYGCAVILESIYEYFPSNSIHICVVDPGVGTERRAVVLKGNDHIFVGPDNGLFSFVVENKKVYMIDTEKLASNLDALGIHLPYRGDTFHGRDIFAPAGALLSMKSEYQWLRSIDGLDVVFKRKYRVEKGRIRGCIIYIDKFGNAITDISTNGLKHMKWVFGQKFKVEINGRFISDGVLSRTYENFKDRLLIIPSSHGTLELAIYMKSVSKRFDIHVGDEVKICPMNVGN